MHRKTRCRSRQAGEALGFQDVLHAVEEFSSQHKQFQKMNNVIDNLEAVLVDAHKVKGWQWVHEEPLWVTWSLEAFGKFLSAYTSIFVILPHLQSPVCPQY